MEKTLIKNNLIPLDKSWIIRMGFLDIIDGRTDISTFLNKQTNLSDDLLALKDIAEKWNEQTEINVGESGTLYRFFQFASWKLGLDKTFVREGTLKERKICDDLTIISLPIKQLLILDNSTSQWASASVLMGNTERVQNPPYKLQVTYDALEHWQMRISAGQVWLPRYDKTILNQALVFEKMRASEPVDFAPKQAEDYCFARLFGFISKKDGERKWPALRGHESDRIAEMESVMQLLQTGKNISSKDHRVVQAVAMYQKLHNLPSTVQYPQSVNKSWPQFWNFLSRQQKK